MDRLGFIYRTDTHVSDRSPASWKGDYPAEIWSNLEQIGRLALEHDAVAVLDGGDYIHDKSASRNSHALVVKSARVHRDYSCPTFATIGNHDVKYNNLATLNEQPLGVLFTSGVFCPLQEQVFRCGDLTVRIVGFPYSPFRTVADIKACKKKPGDTYLIAVIHALAAEVVGIQIELWLEAGQLAEVHHLVDEGHMGTQALALRCQIAGAEAGHQPAAPVSGQTL